MTQSTGPHFEGGSNIAMKVPSPHFDATVAFYRDVLQLPTVASTDTSVVFQFGPNQLWLDRVEPFSQAEVWLELVADDLAVARAHLASEGTIRRDEIEALPEGFEGFWIANPAHIIHLVRQQETG